MRVVGVVLDLGQGEELGPGKGGVAGAGGGLAKVHLGGRLGEGQRVVEGVAAGGGVVTHSEAARRTARHEPGGLERREGAGRLYGAGGAGRGGELLLLLLLLMLFCSPTAQVGCAMVAQILPHHEALVCTTRVILPRVSVESLVVVVMLHQLMAVAAVAAAAVHLGPVVVGRTGQTAAQVAAHRGDRAMVGGGAAGHNRRPLVGAVCVFLHVFGKVGLLGVALAAV